MPDINDRIGLDSLDQNVLQQASQQRLSQLFSPQPNLTNPNTAFSALGQVIPMSQGEYNPGLTTPGQKLIDPDLQRELKEVHAIQATNQYLVKKDPLYSIPIGQQSSLPYAPIKKYVDDTYGFKMDKGQDLGQAIDQNEDTYASLRNGVFSSIGRFLGRTTLGVVAKAGESVSYLTSLAGLNPFAWYSKFAKGDGWFEAAGDNIMSKAFNYMDNDLKDSWMPVYQEVASKGQGFWYRLLHDGSFWQSDISDGAAFALSAFVPAAAASKLALGAKAIAGLAELGVAETSLGENAILGASEISAAQKSAKAFGEASKYVQNAAKAANFIDKSAVTVANTFSEAYFESTDTYNQVYKQLIDKGEGEYTAKKKAQDAAKGTFWANIPALLFSNAFEAKLQFKALGYESIENEALKDIKQAGAFGKYAYEEPVGRWAKFMESPVGFYLKKLPEAILKEGYWEENIQQAIQRYYQDTDHQGENLLQQLKGIGKNYLNQTVQSAIGNDPDTAISIGLGGLMGGVHSIISSAVSREYAKNKEFRADTVKELNNLHDDWLKYKDPFARDEQGNIIMDKHQDETGKESFRPRVSSPKIMAYLSRIYDLSEKAQVSDTVRNEVLNNFIKKALFAELTVANINAGTLKQFKENLNNSKNYSDEDLAKIGLKKDANFNKDIDAHLAFIDKIEKFDKSITDDVLFRKMNSKDDVMYEKARRDALLRNGVLQISMQDLLNNTKSEMNEVTGRLNAKYRAGSTDSLVQELNSLQAQIKYNERALTVTDLDPIQKSSIEGQLSEYNSQKTKLLKENEELANNLKQDSEGNYRYENKDREKDPDSIRYNRLQNRHAQIQNAKNVLSSEWYKMADIKSGLDYFKGKKAKIDEKINEEADQEAEKDKATSAVAETTPQGRQYTEEELKNNPFLKYKEIQDGDFAKASTVASKILFNTDLNEEDKATQEKYKDLINDLVPLYSRKVAEIRKEQLEARIQSLQSLRDDAFNKVLEAKTRIKSMDAQIEEILQHYMETGKRDMKVSPTVQRIIKKLQSDIAILEKYVAKNEPLIDKHEAKINQLMEELKDPTIETVLNLKQQVEKDLEQLRTSISDTKGLIAQLKKILKDLVNQVRELFTGYEPDDPSLVDKSNELDGNILTEAQKLQNLKSTLKDLENEYKKMEIKRDDINKEINQFKGIFKNYTSILRGEAIRDQNQAASQKPVYNELEKAYNKIYKEEIPVHKTLPGQDNTREPEPGKYDESEGYMRRLEYVFYASTDPKFFRAGSNDRTNDHLTFLNNMAQMTSQEIASKIGTNGKVELIYVTGHNINSFGLSGIVDPKYLNTDNVEDAGIYMVYVVRNGKNLLFVDKDLNLLEKVGQLSEENKSKVVFSSLRAARWRDEYDEKARYDEKYPAGETEKALAAAIDYRKDILNLSKMMTPANVVSHPFALTRGIPNKQENLTDEEYVRNPVTQTLIRNEDIGPDIISVPSIKNNNTQYETRSVNKINNDLPVGRPLLKTENVLNSQYHYLNNGKITDEMKDTIKEVLYALASELQTAVEDAITRANGGVPVDRSSLQYLMLMGRLAAQRRLAGITLLNRDYINYLNGVLFFKPLEEEVPVSAADPRQIWLRGDSIVFGNKGNSVSLTDPSTIRDSIELDAFLDGYYHNYNILPETARKQPFVEYHLQDGRLARREWRSYNHYMLSDKNPDGSERKFIPLTTYIKTREQAAAENQYDGKYYPYIQRASIIISQVPEANTKVKSKPFGPPKPGATREEIISNSIAQMLFSQDAPTITFGAEDRPVIQMPGSKPRPVPEALKGDIERTNDMIGKAIEETKKNLPPSPEAPPTPPAGPTSEDREKLGGFLDEPDMPFRRVTTNKVKTETDTSLAEKIKESKRMLPQIPVEVMDTLIRINNSDYAWGAYTGSAIRIFQGSEVGSIYHEDFEALANSLLTDREWNHIYDEFKTRLGSFIDRETGKKLDYKDASQHQAKEQLAEEFMDYKLYGKTWQGSKAKMNFFQRLWNFIKTFLFNLGDIEKTFSRLDMGKYASRSVNPNMRFSDRLRLLKDIPEAVYYKFLQGATAMMLQNVFQSDKSYTDFDRSSIPTAKLYGDLRQALSTRMDRLRSSIGNLSLDPATIVEISKVLAFWDRINSDVVDPSQGMTEWQKFVDDHKTFLRPFSINFRDDDITHENDDREASNANRNDYQQNMFGIDLKKTSSASIRLLFATIVKSKIFQRNANDPNSTVVNPETGVPATVNDTSAVDTVFLPELVNFDEIVRRVFNNMSGLNNLSRLEERLRDLSGITTVKESTNPNATAANLSTDQANLIYLYNRIFGNVKEHEEETRWKMRVKFGNYLAKQNPKPKLMIVTDRGESFFVESNSREDYETLRRIANEHVQTLKGDTFKRFKDKNKVYYKANVKERVITTPAQFNEEIERFFKLGDKFTVQFLNSLSQSQFNWLAQQLTSTLAAIRMRNNANQIDDVSLDGFGIEGRVKDIIRFYTEKTRSGIESSFLNINNESQQNYVLNNYMSRILADLNYTKTLEDFLEENPHLASTFSRDSLILARMFNEGRRTSDNITLGYQEGIMNASDREGTKNSGLDYSERLMLAFNSNINGDYYTLLPADSETEWALNLGNFVRYAHNFEKDRMTETLGIMNNYLKTEIKVAQEDALYNLRQINSKYTDGRRIGNGLRIFRDIIGRNNVLLKTIEQGIEDGTDPDQLIAAHQKAINNAISNYINSLANRNFNIFMNEGIIEDEGSDIYRFNLLNEGFARDLGRAKAQGAYSFTHDEIMNIMKYHATNYFIANTEMFKLFFGDPAQFKDLTKRVKSFTSGVEWSYYEKSEQDGDTGLNGYLNTEKNSVQHYDENGKVSNSVPIPAEDIFNYHFHNKLNLMVTADLEVVDLDLYNQISSQEFKDLLKGLDKNSGVYSKINEADAQSATDIQTYREIMIKSGWRWTDMHERQYQYEMAYARNRMAAKGKYSYPEDNRLRRIDDAILRAHPSPPSYAYFTPLKPLYAGVDDNSRYVMRLLKTSIYPITYRLAEGRELEDLYHKMLNGINGNRINIFTVESSQKIGLTNDINGEITPIYHPENIGELNDYGAAETPIAELSYKHFGIQVETQSKGTGNTLGTQLTKDIKLGLFDNGTPIDYLEDFEKGDRDKAISDWVKMSEADKLAKSHFYRLYQKHESALMDLKSAGYQEMLLRIGANETIDQNGRLNYTFDSLEKARQIILDEMFRRELDENTIDSVQLREDLQGFLRAPETMPSYDVIRNILYALVDKAILSPKVNGKPYIQVASTFFNNEKRKAAYYDKKEDKWVLINNNDELRQAVADGRNVRYTSSELKFYKIIKDGKAIQAMEVMLPSIYKDEINESRRAKGLAALSDQQIIEWLEANQPKLLEGVGFRIPTQATSSVEFFKIKGFLPDTFGGAVVVPSAITAKAGSDFDVDKLNTYLNNYKLNREGMPEYEDYMHEKNSTLEERYDAYMRQKYRAVLRPFNRAIARLRASKSQLTDKMNKVVEDLKGFETYFEEHKTGKIESDFLNKLLNTTFKDMQEAQEEDEATLRSLEMEGENMNEAIQDAYDEYNEMVSKLEKELPIERFAQLPLYAQNSKGALENRYFQSIRDIISQPKMFRYLLSPNSNRNIEENRDAVLDAEGRKKKDKDIHHSNFVDFEYMNLQRHYFVRGKQDIGIFAVAMTNYANSQVSGLVVAPIKDVREANKFHLTTLNTNDFRIPFKHNSIRIDGQNYISISSTYDTDQESIMDKISGYINGAVDVAKDPIIMDMGMMSDLAGVYIFLERAGVDGKTIALFLKQPIIRDYIRETAKRKGILANRSQYASAVKIVEDLLDRKYTNGTPYAYQYVALEKKALATMLRKAANAPNVDAIGNALTPEERRLQQLILANYLKIKVFSDHLLETVQGSNHDTTRIRTNDTITYKNLQAEDARKGNVIKSIAKGELRAGVDAILQDTFVGNDVNLLNRTEKLFGPNFFALQRPNPSVFLKSMARKVFRATKFSGPDAFLRTMRAIQISVLDYLANNAPILDIASESPVPVKTISRTLFATNSGENRSGVSLEAMFNTLKTQVDTTPNHPLKGNMFLDNLVFVDDSNAGITTFEMLVKPSTLDVYTRNRITESLRILRDNASSARFYKSLVLGAIIQNGIGFRRSSINNLIPNEDYGRQLDAGIQTIDNHDFTNHEEILVRANTDNSLVTKSRPLQLFYLDTVDRANLQVMSTPRVEKYSIYNANYFNKINRNTLKIPPVVFLYAGKEEKGMNAAILPDYVVIETIRPEYIMGLEEGYLNKVSPEIDAMIRRGDYSFLMKILLRKMGKATGDVYYFTRPTKESGTNMYAAYKPINYWSSKNFNEYRDVAIVHGDAVGETSILKSNPHINEFPDSDILNLMQTNAKDMELYNAKDPTNLKNEDQIAVEKENNSLSLPSNAIAKEDIDKIINRLEEESDDCK